ncbi:hypothetical protein NE857_01505 [Nocardiopsis exhalans]|uniref:Asp23/Gls24 family envelope stress response protein n=2 Tax=Nocardiopsis TaxID=2013 RepID=A0A840WC76_9ACTN|nr:MULTISPECIES: hypothetical protein [Nocardiopsis]MBB5493744.1 hypothetical protein [Nocardiopsis metallicus]USY20366.1 hypothetical protein NE857_01505 [Nocardiopsis exhalans]
MAVDPSDDHEQLPCGTSADALLDHLREGTATAHERTCPHCLAAAEEFRPLLSALGSALSENREVTAPSGLLDDVMRTVRAEGRSGETLRLPAPGPRSGSDPDSGGAPGNTRIRHSAVSAMLRACVDPAEGLIVGRCRISHTPDGLAVTATARVLAGTVIPDATAAARRAMAAFVADRLGLRVARIDIDVTDVIDLA